jgi:hypothetical protein
MRQHEGMAQALGLGWPLARALLAGPPYGPKEIFHQDTTGGT